MTRQVIFCSLKKKVCFSGCEKFLSLLKKKCGKQYYFFVFYFENSICFGTFASVLKLFLQL